MKRLILLLTLLGGVLANCHAQSKPDTAYVFKKGDTVYNPKIKVPTFFYVMSPHPRPGSKLRFYYVSDITTGNVTTLAETQLKKKDPHDVSYN